MIQLLSLVDAGNHLRIILKTYLLTLAYCGEAICENNIVLKIFSILRLMNCLLDMTSNWLEARYIRLKSSSVLCIRIMLHCICRIIFCEEFLMSTFMNMNVNVWLLVKLIWRIWSQNQSRRWRQLLSYILHLSFIIGVTRINLSWEKTTWVSNVKIWGR